MVSKIDICNFALQQLGGEQISSLSEGSVASNACNLRYESARRAALEAHPWNFALKRVELAKLSTAPSFGFDSAFQLPSDFLRMLTTEEMQDTLKISNPTFNGYVSISNSTVFADSDFYKIETQGGAKVLLSNDDAKKIIYIYDLEDTSLFSPLFVEMVAAQLAAMIAFKITGNRSQQAEMYALADELKKQAQLSDSRQDTNRRTENGVYLASRYY